MVGGLLMVAFLLLAPGFIVMQIVEWLWPSGRGDYREKLVGSIGASFAVYLLYNFFALIPVVGPQKANFILAANSVGLSGDFSVSVYQLCPLSVLWILVISVGLGLLTSRVLTSGWLFKTLAKFGISYETGEHGVWNQAIVQDAQGFMARVYLRDGTTIEGWLSAFSTDPLRRDLWIRRVEKGEDFATPEPVEITPAGEKDAHDIKGPGVLLVSPDILRIEFLDGADETIVS